MSALEMVRSSGLTRDILILLGKRFSFLSGAAKLVRSKIRIDPEQSFHRQRESERESERERASELSLGRSCLTMKITFGKLT